MNRRFCALLLVSTMGGCTSTPATRHAWDPERVLEVELSQLSFRDDSGFHKGTSWGDARIRYRMDQSSETLYLNLFFNGIWVVQNVPVRNGLSARREGKDGSAEEERLPDTHEIAIHFDLGIKSGSIIERGAFACILRRDLWVGGGPEEEIEKIEKKIITIFSGLKGEKVELKFPIVPSKWANGIKAKRSAFHDPNTVVNQNCGYSECFVAAISNSLKMLKKRHPRKFENVKDDPNSEDDAIDMANIKTKTNFTKPGPNFNPHADGMDGVIDRGGSPRGNGTTADPAACWNLKKQWADSSLPIKTTIVDSAAQIKSVIDAIKNGCDVELVTAHAAMITGVVELENGDWVFELVDDVAQGQGPFVPDPNNPAHKGKKAHNGGTYFTLLKYDVQKNEFSGRGHWEGDKMGPGGRGTPIFLIECPK